MYILRSKEKETKIPQHQPRIQYPPLIYPSIPGISAFLRRCNPNRPVHVCQPQLRTRSSEPCLLIRTSLSFQPNPTIHLIATNHQYIKYLTPYRTTHSPQPTDGKHAMQAILALLQASLSLSVSPSRSRPMKHTSIRDR